MASADVSLKLDQGNCVWFANSLSSALIFAIASLGFAFLCRHYIVSVRVGSDVRSRRRTGGIASVGGVAIGNRKYRQRDSEIIVRSDQEILRFGGSLSEADKVWLADACHYASIRGQLP